MEFRNYMSLGLKLDHNNRPLWVLPDGRILLESHSSIYRQAYDFLIAISEPMSRPELIHEYRLTPHSLYAAVSVGLTTDTIIGVLGRLAKCEVPQDVIRFIKDSTKNYGKVKMVLKQNRFFVESPDKDILKRLTRDAKIAAACLTVDTQGKPNIVDMGKALKEHAALDLAAEMLQAAEEAGGTTTSTTTKKKNNSTTDDDDDDKATGFDLANPIPSHQGTKTPEEEEAAESTKAPGTTPPPGSSTNPHGRYEMYEEEEADQGGLIYGFEVSPDQVDQVKARCLPEGLNYPMLEEYDFRNDRHNPMLPFELKPEVKLRPYQEKSLSKMFGNGRSRSGIIVLPCGAGKSLTGISAAARIKKSCVVLCTNNVSVDQWYDEFCRWTSLSGMQGSIAKFTSDDKEFFTGRAGILITTYSMLTGAEGRRSEHTEKIIQRIKSVEWGLLLMDEVHVAPAKMFRRAFAIVKAHCKLGLTATLVREDEHIRDLHFLIGPKLYEANWMDLVQAGHIAHVTCSEIWCPMTHKFMREYLKHADNHVLKKILTVLNPNKYLVAEFLLVYHCQRGDRVIVFCDDLFAVQHLVHVLEVPAVTGDTPHSERTRILGSFRAGTLNAIILSRVGDNSIDIPDANVIIQVASHGASRRQEAQRLGRILRKKRGLDNSAWFYSMVSRDTREMYFSVKRQRFLVNQGYSYKVLHQDDFQKWINTQVVGDKKHLLKSSAENFEDDLLVHILKDFMTMDPKQRARGGAEATMMSRGMGGAVGGGASRRQGWMSALSGGAGAHYAEYNTQNQRGGGGEKKKKTAFAAARDRAVAKHNRSMFG